MSLDLNAAETGAPPARDRGAEYERIAFTFCKAATLVLITGRFALPVISGGAALFYLLADRAGVARSRCILRSPRLIAAFWGTICLVSAYRMILPVMRMR